MPLMNNKVKIILVQPMIPTPNTIFLNKIINPVNMVTKEIPVPP